MSLANRNGFDSTSMRRSLKVSIQALFRGGPGSMKTGACR
jgi:hypothetical protein